MFDLSYAPEFVLLERLLDFRSGVHDEWAVADDRFISGAVQSNRTTHKNPSPFPRAGDSAKY